MEISIKTYKDLQLENELLKAEIEQIKNKTDKFRFWEKKTLKDIIDNANDAVYLHNFEGQIVLTNKKAENTLGYTEDEILGMTILEIDDFSSDLSDYQKLWNKLHTEDNVLLKRYHCRKDQSIFPVLLKLRLLSVFGQNYILVNATDITDLEKKERLFTENQKLLNEITIQSPDIIYIYDLEIKKNTYINKNIKSLLGYSTNEESENSINSFNELIHPDDIEQFDDFYKNIQAWNEDHILEFEYRLKAADGDWRWFVGKEKIFKTEGKEIKQLIGTSRDITARKKAEEKLKRNEKRLKEAQKIAHIGSWDHDVLNEKLVWSDEVYNIFDVEKGKFQCSYFNYLKIVHPADREKVNNAYIKSIEKGTEYNLEYRIITQKGELKYVFAQAKTSYIENKRAIRSIGTIQDITERKLAEKKIENYHQRLEELVKQRTKELHDKNKELSLSIKQLNENNLELGKQKTQLENALNQLKTANLKLIHSEKMASLGMLTAGIAHEINTPLNFITTGIFVIENFINTFNKYYQLVNTLDKSNCQIYTGKLKEFEIKNEFDFLIEAANETIKNINIGSQRIISITKSLKNFSHSSGDSKQLTDINQNIDYALLILQHELKYKTELKKNYGEIPKIMCNPSRINQVFINIIMNAAQAIKDSGEIDIATNLTPDKKFVEIRIRDNGTGIPDEVKEKIFMPFFTTKEIGSGTGLGLYISYNIISEHNGIIDVNTNINQGTEFIIRLPVPKSS